MQPFDVFCVYEFVKKNVKKAFIKKKAFTFAKCLTKN